MSKIKKVLAVFLTLAMVMGMGLTTFAAETTKAIVEVSGIDATIEYVQIVEPDTEESTNGWKISKNFESYFDGKMTVKELIDAAEPTANANAEAGTNTTNSKYADILQSIVDAGLVTESTDGQSFEATKGGLYLITAHKDGWTFSPMVAYVPVNSTDKVTVKAKGAEDKIEKKVDPSGESVEPGEIVPYTATVQYPYFGTNFTDPVFKVTDTLTNAKYEDGSIVVAYGVNQVALVENTDYTLTINADKNTFEINFIYDVAKAGGAVTISYSAIANDDINSTTFMSNQIQSSIAPTADAEPTRTEHKVVSGTVKAQFTKVDSDENEKKLAGAEFQLYKGEVDSGVAIGDPEVADENGVVTFEGLDANEKYYVIETKAPDGYSIDKTPHVLTRSTEGDDVDEKTITENGVTTITTTYTYVNDFITDGAIVPNTTLSSLPSTGGIGTTIFTIGGCLIMIIAAALFFASRRKNNK